MSEIGQAIQQSKRKPREKAEGIPRGVALAFPFWLKLMWEFCSASRLESWTNVLFLLGLFPLILWTIAMSWLSMKDLRRKKAASLLPKINRSIPVKDDSLWDRLIDAGLDRSIRG